jgi:hypothetical protein
VQQSIRAVISSLRPEPSVLSSQAIPFTGSLLMTSAIISGRNFAVRHRFKRGALAGTLAIKYLGFLIAAVQNLSRKGVSHLVLRFFSVICND